MKNILLLYYRSGMFLISNYSRGTGGVHHHQAIPYHRRRKLFSSGGSSCQLIGPTNTVTCLSTMQLKGILVHMRIGIVVALLWDEKWGGHGHPGSPVSAMSLCTRTFNNSTRYSPTSSMFPNLPNTYTKNWETSLKSFLQK